MKNLLKCPKCGNIMALRTIIENSEKMRIKQCFVCRYWEPMDKDDISLIP